ncbi:FCS-Like Zinc finger 7-like [Andrographis paniculata]|uniref:FCS-Like Zinc finger 7-like n=1 Tax=Andrographis paniculata TaxID=175694 RepID=UPI0021E6F376|nr:FCS-Like Zinc finger 7-like [Andrographis paniculata]
MLGKRGRRPSFRRTTSMSGIEIDVGAAELPPHHQSAAGGYDHFLSPRYLRRTSSDVETADFLTRCGFCARRLAPGRDIYMYRGDTAFCSLECREQQMKQDERKERLAAVAPPILEEDDGGSHCPEAETVAAA